MQPRTLLMLLVGFVGGLIVSACSPAATCSPATCGGCCDTSGKCQSGATPEFCGSNGVACARCGTGTICQQNECRAGSNGGGGGATGGGGGATGGGTGGGTTGGGTGGGGGCRTITMLETTQMNLGLAEYRTFTSSVGHYNYAGWIYLVSGANPNSFRMEMVYPNDVVPSFPYTETFTSATRYRTCIACAIFYESCDPQTTACQKEYLGQAGSMTITRADRATAGRAQGSAMNVRFNEWDLASDTAAGPGCIIVNTIGPWDIGWNADGGMPPP